jgi:hypothetical protein
MATNDQRTDKRMRRAAEFVLNHHRLLQHALVGQALTLDAEADVLYDIARQGGNNLITAQAATETAQRKQAEAAGMRNAQAALEALIDSPEPSARPKTAKNKPGGRHAR